MHRIQIDQNQYLHCLASERAVCLPPTTKQQPHTTPPPLAMTMMKIVVGGLPYAMHLTMVPFYDRCRPCTISAF
jgi:hypothetical protein